MRNRSEPDSFIILARTISSISGLVSFIAGPFKQGQNTQLLCPSFDVVYVISGGHEVLNIHKLHCKLPTSGPPTPDELGAMSGGCTEKT